MLGRRQFRSIVGGALVILGGGFAHAQRGALSGVVIETLDDSSMLVQVGERGDPAVTEVRLEIGKKGARDAEAPLVPTGWRTASDGGTVILTGPAQDPPLHVRLEPGAPGTVQGTVGVQVFSNGDLVFKDKVSLTARKPSEVDLEDPGAVIVMPPSLDPGETITTTVVDPARAPSGGRWTLDDSGGKTGEPREADGGEYTVTFDVPADLSAGDPVGLVYVDPWGVTTIDTDVGDDIAIGSGGADTGPPRIDSGQRYVFVGQTGCVCGFFPNPESRSSLLVGGRPVGEPVASSSSSVVFRLPEGTTPGEHAVTVGAGAGFEEPIEVEIIALQLSGSIDQELLMRGQSTPMRIEIAGTDQPLELLLTNNTPEIISLEGGEEGVVTTSGGKPNSVERIVHGRQRGDFHITYMMANDPCPCGPEGTDTMTGTGETSPVQTGYPVPSDVTVGTPVSTGRTTGTIAEVEVTNDGTEPIVFPDRPVLIDGSDEHQGYVVPGGTGTTVPPGGTRTVPLDGYCTDVRKPPVPPGEPLPDPSEWTVPRDPSAPFPEPGDPGFEDEELGVRIIGGTEAITRTTEELQESGELKTPFSSNPERERETVNQQTIWRYTSELEERPYTREEFDERLEEQYEERTGTSIESAPEEDRERLEQGADDFWEAFELVGEKAKVFEPEEEMPTTTPESVPVTTEGPVCGFDRSMEHSDAESDFKMSESYKDDAKRDNLKQWFGELPRVADTTEGGTFEAGKYPASAWAVAGRDYVGGYTNAVAKHIYLEASGGYDVVWSTELMEVDANSDGSHTLTVTPPPEGECESLVVGAGGAVVEAWSNAIDPIADDRDVLTALRIVRDVSLAVATGGASLAVSLGTMAATMAFDEAFSSDANAAAAVEGRLRIQVQRRRVDVDANSRTTLSGDGDIQSDASRVATGETSDTHPTTLTVTTDGRASLKSQASDNGIAEATLESQVGVAIVGFCRCGGGGVQIGYLTDSGLFLVEEGAAAAATRTAERLEAMVGEIVDTYLDLPPEQVIPKALADLPTDLESLLRRWYLENGKGEGKPGYFPVDAGMLE